jgi:conjugative relaxase-like TrwC/TraI family protein
MLSVSTCNAAMAANYYEQDNYYARDQVATDSWQGELCEEVGLKNGQHINAEQFQLMLENSGKCAAYDLTFSAPKSVSIASEMSPELRADMVKAHHEAVTETLRDIEKQEIGTRITKNGETQWTQTGKMAAAKFDHNVSREGDMQMHTHAVVMNMTEHEGKSYSIDGHRLFENQKIYGQEYRNLLATKLQDLGYRVEVTDPEKGFFELTDIREDVRQHFSKRREQIKAELQKNGESGAQAAQRANLKTRKVKEHIDIEKKRIEWRQDLEKLKQALPEKNSNTAWQNQTDKTAAFKRAISQLAKENFAWTEKSMEQAVMANGCKEGMTRQDVAKLLKQSKLVALKPKTNSKLAASAEKYYTTKENIRIEKKIVDDVVLNKGKMRAIQPNIVKKTLAEVSHKNGWNLGKEQQMVVNHIASSTDQFIAVRGLAGTGKTFALNAAREVLEVNGYQVKGMSATGEAADELAADANIKECSTIHHSLNAAERKAGNSIAGEDYANKSSWNFEGMKPDAKDTVWFVDEASLTDNNLFSNIQKMAKASAAKIVFIGDDRQMPPVSAGNAYANLVQRGQIATVELSDIRRQKEPGLLKAVEEAVKGETKVSLDTISENIKEIPTRLKRLNAVTKAYTSLSPAEQAETLVLTARNKDRIEINNRIRKQLVQKGQVASGQRFDVQYGKDNILQERYFAQGDKVVFLQNDMKLGVKNGTKGRVTKINGNNITAAISGSKSVTINIKNYNHIDHGYCVTAHKSQGVTVKRAIVHMSSKDRQLNSRNSYYVDISRAKQHVQLFCDSRAKLDPQISEFVHKITSRDFHTLKGKKLRAVRGAKLVKLAKVKTPKVMSVAGKIGGLGSLVSLPINMIRTAIDLIKIPFEITKGHEKIRFPNATGKILGDIRKPEKSPEMNIAKGKDISPARPHRM